MLICLSEPGGGARAQVANSPCFKAAECLVSDIWYLAGEKLQVE